jgi:DNA repair photolyase
VLLGLPHELKEVWCEWLALHYPERAAHVMSLIQQMRGGKDYDSAYGTRMRGEGPFADLTAMRFDKACNRMGFGLLPPMDSSRFMASRVPHMSGRACGKSIACALGSPMQPCMAAISGCWNPAVACISAVC